MVWQDSVVILRERVGVKFSRLLDEEQRQQQQMEVGRLSSSPSLPHSSRQQPTATTRRPRSSPPPPPLRLRVEVGGCAVCVWPSCCSVCAALPPRRSPVGPTLQRRLHERVLAPHTS